MVTPSPRPTTIRTKPHHDGCCMLEERADVADDFSDRNSVQHNYLPGTSDYSRDSQATCRVNPRHVRPYLRSNGHESFEGSRKFPRPA